MIDEVSKRHHRCAGESPTETTCDDICKRFCEHLREIIALGWVGNPRKVIIMLLEGSVA